MLDDLPILSMIAFSPLLGVLILLFLPARNGKWIRIAGVWATVIPLLLATWLYVDFSTTTTGYQYAEQFSWIHLPLSLDNNLLSQGFTGLELRFDYTMAVDGLSLPLVFLTALIATMAALASKFIKKRWKLYYILFLLLETGMFGVFMAQDLFLFFLFFEITLVPMFFLIGIWGYIHRERAANKFLLYNGLGSAVMLIAFLVIVATAGFVQQDDMLYYTGHLGEIKNNLFGVGVESYVNADDPNNPFYLKDALEWTVRLWGDLSWTIDGKSTVFLLLLIAFGIKLPIFPFHTWMLKVHSEAPPSIVMIHSGILLKMGAYGLIRFGVLMFPEEARNWAVALAVLGVINVLYGAVLALRQEDFKLVLAYSSISHMGIVLLGIAAFNQAGIQGAIFQMISHGLISALLFLMVGSIYERTETSNLRELGGLAKAMPFIGGILMIGGMASLGLPGLSGFPGELLAFLGLFDSMRAIAIVGAAGIILAAVYVLRGVLGITYGPILEKYRGLRDARLIEAVPMIVLVAFILLLGVYPGILTQTMQQTVADFDSLIQIIAAKIGG
ncbi:MAG: proton-translocating NADH-quinone oxidoreductase subunit [Paenibacillaceae bacterium]|jgi:NADH-quinone oxidoreductase subunit M|nr:proton-translocating NADH-quinone oxidoreductase subunit [Paenibacillaceae bacterium]